MPRRLSFTLIPCVAIYMLVAMTSSTVPRRATAKVPSAGTRPAADALSMERSGYIVASS